MTFDGIVNEIDDALRDEQEPIGFRQTALGRWNFQDVADINVIWLQ